MDLAISSSNALGSGTSTSRPVMTTSSGAATSVTTTTIASTTNLPTRDPLYCLELAKRSVARAALHLGITTMTQDLLNVLGDVLCEYLQRLGSVLAQGVESSGRSTQHVNALDMLKAVELCTSPAVSRVHFTSAPNSVAAGAAAGAASAAASAAMEAVTGNPSPNNNNNNNYTNDMEDYNGSSKDKKDGNTSNSNTNTQSHPPGSWQALATFCFGPKWQDHVEKELEVAELQGAGGKVGPKSTNFNQQEESAKDVQEGWRAPFPDEVPPFPLVISSGRVHNPHSMSHHQVLTALYGKQQTIETNPLDIVRGKNLISAQEAEQERQQTEAALGQMPESVWGGFGAGKTDSNPTGLGANPYISSSTAATATDASSHPGTNGGSTGNNEKAPSAGSKRKLDDETSSNKDDGKKDDGTKKDAMDTTSSDAAKSKEQEDKEGAASKPAKKKVKIEDGSAKATKTSTPNKKKKAGANNSKEDDKQGDGDVEMKDAPNATSDAKQDPSHLSSAVNTATGAKSSTGRTFNFVPIFYPPIPNMGTGQDGAHLRKTTVVDLLERPPQSALSSSGTTAAAPGDATKSSTSPSATNSNNVTSSTTFGLRSALVQLGTSYWGSQADAEPSPSGAAATDDDGSKVPAGRSNTAADPQSQGPIVPLGRASGSRVSRILEGSMDAAAMQ